MYPVVTAVETAVNRTQNLRELTFWKKKGKTFINYSYDLYEEISIEIIYIWKESNPEISGNRGLDRRHSYHTVPQVVENECVWGKEK